MLLTGALMYTWVCVVCRSGRISLPIACRLLCLQVGNRVIVKRLHVRIEHVMPSRCREEFLKRRQENDAARAEAKAKGGEQRC